MSVVVEEGASESLALQRLRALCDPGSLSVIRSQIVSRRLNSRAREGDGIVAGTGEINGRPIVCYAQDQTFLGGSLGEAHAESVLRILRLAGEARCPVVSIVSSAGARMQEGIAALAGYARIFHEQVKLAGKVPQISIVMGTSAGGGSYSPALADFVVMDAQASMFLTGPGVVHDVMRETVTALELGGAKVHTRNGVCDLVGADEDDCIQQVRQLMSFLPQCCEQQPPLSPGAAPEGSPGRHVPDEPRKVYDVRSVIEDLVDDGEFIETCARWAPNIVTGFARIDGRAVGFVANQPSRLGGVIDAEASQKAARFINRVDGFGLPLVVLVDTPGFLPGTKQEGLGVIRHGADLLRAFASARVTRITVILRKAYGGAYITMNSRDLGAHLTFAWPCAEIGIMGADQAVGVIHRRELEVSDEREALRARLASLYADEHLSVDVAVQDGFVDEVIFPQDTRNRLIWGLRTLAHRKRRSSDSPDAAGPRAIGGSSRRS
jgi:acetyl-CoA carboxylase carboxyltransferase component